MLLPLARNTQFFGHPNKLSERSRPHFLHDVAAMDLDGFFCSLQFVSDLLIQHSQYNTFHDFALARRQQFITSAQVFELCTFEASCLIGIDSATYGVQELWFAERFGQE